MARNKQGQSVQKRQRERQKQLKRMEKEERRLMAKEEKLRATSEGDSRLEQDRPVEQVDDEPPAEPPTCNVACGRASSRPWAAEATRATHAGWRTH